MTSICWTMDTLDSSFADPLSCALVDLPTSDDPFAFDPLYASPSFSDSTCSGELSDSDTSSSAKQRTSTMSFDSTLIKHETMSPLPLPLITDLNADMFTISPPPAPLSSSGFHSATAMMPSSAFASPSTITPSNYRVQAFPSFPSAALSIASSSSGSTSPPACLLLAASKAPAKGKGTKRARKPVTVSATSSTTSRRSPSKKASASVNASDDSDEDAVKKERNKECAKNYRKRRKEQAERAQGELEQLRDRCAQQQTRISALEAENRALKDQVSFLQTLVSGARGMAPSAPNAAMFVLFSCFVFCLSGSLFAPSLSGSHAVPASLSATNAGGVPFFEDNDVSVNGYKGRSLLSVSDEARCLLEGVDQELCKPLPWNGMDNQPIATATAAANTADTIAHSPTTLTASASTLPSSPSSPSPRVTKRSVTSRFSNAHRDVSKSMHMMCSKASNSSSSSAAVNLMALARPHLPVRMSVISSSLVL